jgi:hypothetical protein
MKYDILILSKNEDLNKINFLIQSIEKNLENYNKIYLISETSFPSEKFINFTDEDVIDINIRSQINYRPKWIFQQYLKLFQRVTELDLYLVIDSDIYINRKIELFVDDKPLFFLGQDQYHKPYFDYLNYFSINKNYTHSFISEMMFFSKKKVQDFIESVGFYTSESFMNFSNTIINDRCYISEFELYGNFILQNHSNYHGGFKKLISNTTGRHSNWSDEDIIEMINKNQHLDIISYHTWK